ncbi:nucleolin isoform X1 [Xiphias gladius]|uniref:nucleolin isoform X1 n=1 Tax=Xiphias gladius TaxID=8245 RepID=UPI001A9A0C13|nr:nucleolin isoform X1 [Xiphias gladius]
MVKLAKAANKQATQKKKAPPPPKEVEEESSEEESSDEEEETPPPKVVKKATPAKATPVVKNGTAAKKAESEDDDDDEDEDSEEESEEEAPPPKKTPAKATAAKSTPAKAAPAKAEESDDDEDDDDDESEEEAPPPKKAAKPAAKLAAKPPVKAQPAKESSDDDDEDSEEEAPAPKKATPAKPAAKQAAKAQPAKEASDDDDDEDDSEEEMDTTPAPPATKAKKAGMVKAKEESEEEDDDEDDDDQEAEAPVTPGKRKAESKKDTPPAKKAKSEGEGFCLFVGNLNSNKDFEEIKSSLRKFFTKNSLEVADVRLGGSKKFGYVDFASEEDMQKALELNGKKVMGQELKLDKARSKDSSQEGKKERDARTLFVKNLPFSATADDLREVFEDAVDVRLPPGQNGSNRGIAYIEFKTEAEAEKMLEEAQGADVQGRSIMIDYVGEKSQKGARVAATGGASKTLVVNNLAFSATEEVLQSTFEKAVSIRIPQKDGRAKGFAFVEFESTDDAKEALENLNNTDIEGRSVRLEYSQNSGGRDGGRGNSGPTKTLFVKGLSEDTTDHTLKDAFDGAVAARIVTDRDTGSSKGFGFVDFDNEEDCKAAKEAMEDGEIDGSKVTLDYAKPKGEGGFRGGRGGGGFGGRGGGRGGRGGFGGRGGGGRGGGRGGPRGGGRGGGRGGFGGGRGGGGFGAKPQGKKIKFDD